jgi:hypothetical protein
MKQAQSPDEKRPLKVLFHRFSIRFLMAAMIFKFGIVESGRWRVYLFCHPVYFRRLV